jgi:hypothetical protein
MALLTISAVLFFACLLWIWRRLPPVGNPA